MFSALPLWIGRALRDVHMMAPLFARRASVCDHSSRKGARLGCFEFARHISLVVFVCEVGVRDRVFSFMCTALSEFGRYVDDRQPILGRDVGMGATTLLPWQTRGTSPITMA